MQRDRQSGKLAINARKKILKVALAVTMTQFDILFSILTKVEVF